MAGLSLQVLDLSQLTSPARLRRRVDYLPSLPRIRAASRPASPFPTKSGLPGLRTPHRHYRWPCGLIVGTSEYDPVPNTLAITGVFSGATPQDFQGTKGV